ncbi:MAG TPA: hypothetical protein VHO90_04590 [Bacteroidales bacterium]|nr:hypothetical protein [Bacteroidales bacterium]
MEMLNGKTFIFLTLFTGTVSLSSCKKDDKEKVPVTPPPLSSLSIDFSFLTFEKTASFNHTNWQYTTVSLSIWNSILNDECSIPVEAFEKTAEKQGAGAGKNTWEWKTGYQADTTTIVSRLRGTMNDDSIRWELYIATKSNQKTSPEFLWMKGNSSGDQTGGWWLIYENPMSMLPLVKINWSKANETSSHVRYTYVKPGDSNTGIYLENGPSDNMLYDNYYFLELPNENKIAIELNTTSKEGHIKSLMLFSDTVWHCWNASLQNTNCN